MDLNSYFDKGYNYKDYHKEVEKQLQKIEEEGDLNGFAKYYKMNLSRISRLDKTFELSSGQKEELNNKNHDFRLLTISEGWCGDAAQSVPVVQKMMNEAGVQNRIVFRDENPELMNAYLTDGAKGIPIFIGIDKEGNELFHFGPRPKYGMEMLAKHKADPENYSEAQFHEDLQIWYNQDKGESTVKEFLEAMI